MADNAAPSEAQRPGGAPTSTPSSAPARGAKPRSWRSVAKLTFVVATAVSVIVVVAVALVQRSSLQSQSEYLERIQRHEVVLIDILARAEPNAGLAEIVSSYEALVGQGRNYADTGEIVLAHRVSDRIEFLLDARAGSNTPPASVPVQGVWAEPMRRALNDERGIVNAQDYIGKRVLAAYGPAADGRLGVVAKIDLRETRVSYVSASFIIAGVSLLAALLGCLATLLRRRSAAHEHARAAPHLARPRGAINVDRLPRPVTYAIAALCVAPLLLMLLGVELSSPSSDGVVFPDGAPAQNALHDALAGSFVHALLEWWAVGAAVFTGVLALALYTIRRVPAIAVFGVALCAAGVMDAFHTFAAIGFIETTNGSVDFIPFTWALSRVFVSSIIFLGLLSLTLSRRPAHGNVGLILGLSVVFTMLAGAMIYFCAEASWLPQTQFPGEFVSRPFEAAPLALFVLALPLAWSLNRRSSTVFSHAILVSLAPQIAAQLCMAFGSSRLFDGAFNAAHALKIVAYMTPLAGVMIDYLGTIRSDEKNRAKLEMVIEGSNDGIWSWPDVDRDDQWWSPRFYELLGRHDGEVEASRSAFEALLHGADAARVTRAIDDALGTDGSFDARFRLRTGSGAYRWLRGRATVTRDGPDAPRRMAGSITDVTREVVVEEALAFRQHALDEHTIVGMTDAKGRITYANDRFCQISKYTREELLGQDHRIINSGHHDKAFFREMYATIGGGRTWRGEIRNRAKDGSIYWVDTTIVPRLDDAGKIMNYVSIRTDITDRKNAEEEVQRANEELTGKNAELEQFVYTVSHDLKAPIVSLKGFTGWMKEDLEAGKTEDLAKCAGRIEQAAHRMEHLVSDLLDLSRAARVEADPDPVDLNKLIAGVLDDYRAEIDERGVSIEVTSLPVIRGDARRLWQAFDNLIRNALKYGCNAETPRIRVGFDRPEDAGDDIRLYVADNGPGVPKAYREKIFGLFERLENDREGTGVGLALVQRVVEGHNGRVWVSDAPGGGAEFSLSFHESAVGDTGRAERTERVRVAA